MPPLGVGLHASSVIELEKETLGQIAGAGQLV